MQYIDVELYSIDSGVEPSSYCRDEPVLGVHGKAPSQFLLPRGGSKCQPCQCWSSLCKCRVGNCNGGHTLSAKRTAAMTGLVWHVSQVRS